MSYYAITGAGEYLCPPCTHSHGNMTIMNMEPGIACDACGRAFGRDPMYTYFSPQQWHHRPVMNLMEEAVLDETI